MRQRVALRSCIAGVSCCADGCLPSDGRARSESVSASCAMVAWAIDGADRLAILSFDACHVQTLSSLLQAIAIFKHIEIFQLRASLSIHGPDREVYKSLRWTDRRGPRIKLGRTTRAASSRPRLNGTRRLTLEHDRVGTGSMAGRGYVPEQPATQCEGTCARAD